MRSLRCVILPLARRAWLVALTGTLVAPALAWAHIERASYWPLPAPDCSVSPCAGGQVPTARTLASAVATGGPGVTRVVCQSDSITRSEEHTSELQSLAYLVCRLLLEKKKKKEKE